MKINPTFFSGGKLPVEENGITFLEENGDPLLILYDQKAMLGVCSYFIL